MCQHFPTSVSLPDSPHFQDRPALAQVALFLGIEQGVTQVDKVKIDVLNAGERRSAWHRLALRISSGALKSCSLESSV